MLHRVNKLQFEAICSTEAEAFEVRHSFSHSYQARISEIIDKVCTAYTSELEWIHLDNIEIDLGKIDLNSFDAKFADILLEKFEEEFASQIKLLHGSEKIISKEQSNFQILVYFLKTGSLPWWADEETADINSIFLELQDPKIIYQYLELHRFESSFWERMALQFNEQVHDEIFSFFPKLISAKKRITGWFRLLGIDLIPGRDLQRFILMNASTFYSDVVEKPMIHSLLSKMETDFVLKNTLLIPIEEKVERIMQYEKQFDSREKAEFYHDTIVKTPESIESVTDEQISLEKFKVMNCGIILLAPYFKSFFSQLNLLENGAWKNRDSQIRAIHLVRYLATGQQMCPEHSLLFEKILCGMELNRPIPRDIGLSEDEITESTDLLNSILSHWVRLKNTSVQGLRQTFFKRDGILTKKDNGWLLQVERKTVDVLLDDIPWSYSTVILPWTKYIIYTEW